MMIQKTTETIEAGRVKLLTNGFEQSLTEACNSTTSLFGHTDCLRRPVNTHYKLCSALSFANQASSTMTARYAPEYFA